MGETWRPPQIQATPRSWLGTWRWPRKWPGVVSLCRVLRRAGRGAALGAEVDGGCRAVPDAATSPWAALSFWKTSPRGRGAWVPVAGGGCR